jgi:membrane-associated protein
METLSHFFMQLIDLLRHLDVWINNTVSQYGTLTYGIIFAIVFAETGLVIMPFLPGDSLLFALGAFSATPNAALKLAFLYPLLMVAAFCGDNVNYWLGRTLGRNLFGKPESRILNRAYLAQTEEFFARHGGKALILARFVPIVRTFAPFVAGMGNMPYGRFLAFSIASTALWVGLCVTGGYLFGNLPVVRNNFEKVIIGIILVSLLPAVIEFTNHRRKSKESKE